jgi:hypothetical protein
MWRPGTGHTYFGEKQEHFFAWFVPQPSADLIATLKVEGETFQLKGNGQKEVFEEEGLWEQVFFGNNKDPIFTP